MKLEKLQTLTVAPYTNKILTDHAVAPRYYNVKRKKAGKPTKTIKKKIETGLYKVDKKGFVLDPLGEKMIANKRTVGKPRYQIVKGNAFTTGFYSPGYRNATVKIIKNFLSPFIKDQLTVFNKLPLYIDFKLYLDVSKETAKFDLSNLWFWNKYMEDLLFEDDENPLIPDDNYVYITKSGGCPTLVPIDTEDSKLVWTFYHDTRPSVKKHETYKHLFV